MRIFAGLFLLIVVSLLGFGQSQAQESGAQVQLRGISAVSATEAWASGAGGTILRTVDGGQTWQKLSIAGTEKLDFRDIQAFDDQTAYVLSIGPGDRSRIYKTHDGGQHWDLQFTNPDPKAFYDCFAFWDSNHGIAISDSVDGKFPLLATTDGSTWSPLAPKKMPAALPNEGAFAASGTCVATFGDKDVWFATGGPAARVFHSSNRGRNWSVTATPILSGQPSQGIFSIAFWDSRHGVIVGGDYLHPDNAEKNAAYTQDGGRTWILSAKPPSGYRSGVAFSPTWLYLGKHVSLMLMCVGTTGADGSTDGGKTWTKENAENYNSISISQHVVWVVGPNGPHAAVPLAF